ncbi:MAG: rRNA methyltransferase, partial [Anaerolineae bacterium]|nr:rRNA methyltransferase [Anaerolineae bacterium]
MITSLKNAKVRLIRDVMSNRRRRTQEKLFFIEGVHAITAAYDHGWNVQHLITCPDTVRTDWAREIIERTPTENRVEVNEYVQIALSERSSPSELMALAVQRKDDPARIPIVDNVLVLLLDRPHSPGNIGSVIRSADALGAHAVIITGHAADPYDAKAVRASMGSLFALPVVRIQEHAQLEAWIAQTRETLGALQIVATSAHAGEALYEHDLTGPTVLAIGN